MKKFLVAFFAVVAIVSGCSQKSGNNQNESGKSEEKKVLVAYFSATGTTREVAYRLANEAGAKLFEIVPEKLYGPYDLDWTNENSRSSVEMKDKENSRPAIKNTVENMEQYETIFVGFPIWWYTCPTIINTFLESYDLKGKTIIPFATSGGSPIEPCVADMKKSAKGAIFKEGKLLNNVTDDELKIWIESSLK